MSTAGHVKFGTEVADAYSYILSFDFVSWTDSYRRGDDSSVLVIYKCFFFVKGPAADATGAPQP